MTGPIVQGEGRGFRRIGSFERAVGQLGGVLERGSARAVLGRAFEAALWIGTAGRGLRSVLPHGEVVRLAPRYRGMSWNVEEYRAFRAATRPGDTVVDAGANTGAYTLLFAQWAGAAGRVFAFEPVPANAGALRTHLALNGISGRVSVVEAALGERDGEMVMTAPGPVGLNRRALPSDTGDRLTVPVVSLDSFCRTYGVSPAVVKIDVEGAELDVLRGACGVLSAHPHLFVEFHPTLWPDYGVSRDSLEQELRRQGLQAQPLRDRDDVWSVEGICARLTPA